MTNFLQIFSAQFCHGNFISVRKGPSRKLIQFGGYREFSQYSNIEYQTNLPVSLEEQHSFKLQSMAAPPQPSLPRINLILAKYSGSNQDPNHFPVSFSHATTVRYKKAPVSAPRFHAPEGKIKGELKRSQNKQSSAKRSSLFCVHLRLASENLLQRYSAVSNLSVCAFICVLFAP